MPENFDLSRFAFRGWTYCNCSKVTGTDTYRSSHIRLPISVP